MRAGAFEYVRPKTLTDALGILAGTTAYTQLMAGGQSLVAMGAIAPPAAIGNAVRDALAVIGAEVNETPMTPRRVLAAIRNRAAGKGS